MRNLLPTLLSVMLAVLQAGCAGAHPAAEAVAFAPPTPPATTPAPLAAAHGHGHGAMRGLAAEENSADACTRTTGWSAEISPEQQAVINDIVGTREHRTQHALWHASRGGLTAAEKTEVIDAFGPAWGQLHALCPAPQSNADAADYNAAGEDFLYMHRGMIGMIRAGLMAKNLPCIEGFKQVPKPAEWPLPDAVKSGAKSSGALDQLQLWEKKFTDPAWLKDVSLSQVGWALEFTIHNNLHMRYATDKPPHGFSGVAATGGAPVPYNGRFPRDWKYDGDGYNWLADPYGAALNPTFWKIHGYVDHIIDLWLQAHGYQTIAESCQGIHHCYQWKGTWTGEVEEHSISRAMTAAAHGVVRPITADPFTQRRMRLQNVGVLTDEDTGGDVDPNAPEPHELPRAAARRPVGDDPLSFTDARLCATPR